MYYDFSLFPYSVTTQSRKKLKDRVDWALRALRVGKAWKKTRGKGVKVAILDSGFAKGHPDLQRAVSAYKDFTKQGIYDGDGHGTHVAGIVGARANDIGIVGVAPRCKLIIVKVLNNRGWGRTSWIVDGIKWAADQGADIISMSLGSNSPMAGVKRALRALPQNVFIVAAAGNSGPRANTVCYPAKYGLVISVGAITRARKVAKWSSRGMAVDVVAPGDGIISCYPRRALAKMSGTCIAEGSYIYTPQGPCQIESIAVGDTVFAFYNSKLVERTVTGVHDRGLAEVHRLVAAGRDVKATASHRILCVNTRERDLEWVRLGELRQYHRLLMPKRYYSRVNPYLDSVLSLDFCWLLGFFAGDGWLSETTRSGRINFAKSDKPQVDKMVADLYHKCVGKMLRDEKDGRWMYDDSSSIAMIIATLGMDNPAQSKNFPLWLWNLPKNKRMAFYGGYLRADATTDMSGRYRYQKQTFECVSPDLVRRAAIFADYEGWKHGFVRSRTRDIQAPHQLRKRPCTTHLLTLNEGPPLDGISVLGSGGGSGAALAAKRFAGMGLDTSEFFLSRWKVRENESSTVKVYDLSVPQADCFVTQGLVTHNSMACPVVAGVMALALAKHKTHGGNTPINNRQDMLDHLIKSCVDLGKSGRDPNYGYGLVNPNRLLA